MAISSKLALNFFFNTVHNLISFSMVFTNKNRGGTLCPPPPIITKVYLPLIITKVKGIVWYHFQYGLWGGGAHHVLWLGKYPMMERVEKSDSHMPLPVRILQNCPSLYPPFYSYRRLGVLGVRLSSSSSFILKSYRRRHFL